MKKLTVYVFILLLSFSCKTNIPLKNPQVSVKSSIKDCIKLLEKKKYEELLDRYIYPDAKKEALQYQSLSEMAKAFESKAQKNLEAMKVALNQKIEYRKNSTVAVIHLDGKVKGLNKIVFMKKDNRWYIAD